MFKFWSLILEPLIRAIAARRIIEVGVENGDCTKHLLAYCAEVGGHLDYIDPCPGFDTATAQETYGAVSTFHRSTSLETLPQLLEMPEVALLDGDHNWYTVYHELKLLKAKADVTGAGFPLVLFHDVAWPYGRRDMYYAIERIPSEYRQPHAHMGIQPGLTQLVTSGGLNAQLSNALLEGGKRNGVLTAVEDFVEESKVGKLHVIPILFGLGILVPDRLAENQALQAEIQRWESVEGLKTLLDLVEGDRIREMAWGHGELVRSEADRRHLLGRIEDLTRSVYVEHAERDRTAAEFGALTAERDRLRAALDLIHSSTTWRWTRVVRTAAALIRRRGPWNEGGNGR